MVDDEYLRNRKYIEKLRSEVSKNNEQSSPWEDVASSINLDVLSSFVDVDDDAVEEHDDPEPFDEEANAFDFNRQLLTSDNSGGIGSPFDDSNVNPSVPFGEMMRKLLKYWRDKSFDKDNGVMIDGVGYVTGVRVENGVVVLTTV